MSLIGMFPQLSCFSLPHQREEMMSMEELRAECIGIFLVISGETMFRHAPTRAHTSCRVVYIMFVEGLQLIVQFLIR